MQTTLRINNRLYRRAKAKSGELGMSLTRFFEEAVENRLERLEQKMPRKIALPECSVSGKAMSHDELRRKTAEIDFEDDGKSVG